MISAFGIAILILLQVSSPATAPATEPRFPVHRFMDGVSSPDAPPTTKPGEAPMTLAEAKLKDQSMTLADTAAFPVVDVESPEKVAQLTIHDNDLRLETSLTNEEAVVRAPGLTGLSRVRIQMAGEGKDAVLLQFSLENVDYTATDAIAVHTEVSQVPGQIILSQAKDRLDDETHHVQLIQTTSELGEGENRVSLYVQITGTPPVDLKLGAENIVELRRKFPGETSRYVDPIFRTLRQEGLLARVEPRLAWQVFADAYKPPPEMSDKTRALVKRLDAERFQDREAASRELEALGQSAALTLAHEDRKGLSDEQLSRIDAFLSKFKTASDEEVARLRTDRDFLLDCLFSEELPIRQNALDALKTLTGRPIDFDLSAPPDQRLAGIEKLRTTLGATAATKTSIRE